MASAFGVLALAAAGCGAETHSNEPRPQVPTHVSVSIGKDRVLVRPGDIGTGPERLQQIPQNQNHEQPPIRSDDPLNVVFVVANQTDFDSQLEIRGPKDATSGPMVPRSSGSFQTELPSGSYVISAADVPGARPAKLVVGSYRTSSENNVLTP